MICSDDLLEWFERSVSKCERRLSKCERSCQCLEAFSTCCNRLNS